MGTKKTIKRDFRSMDQFVAPDMNRDLISESLPCKVLNVSNQDFAKIFNQIGFALYGYGYTRYHIDNYSRFDDTQVRSQLNWIESRYSGCRIYLHGVIEDTLYQSHLNSSQEGEVRAYMDSFGKRNYLANLVDAATESIEAIKKKIGKSQGIYFGVGTNVYLMHMVDMGFYKIGISKNVERRIRQLSKKHGKIELSTSFPAPVMYEKFLHSKFHSSNIEKEFFRLTPKQVSDFPLLKMIPDEYFGWASGAIDRLRRDLTRAIAMAEGRAEQWREFRADVTGIIEPMTPEFIALR